MNVTALIVDDDADVRRGLGLLLRGRVSRSEDAADGAAALEILRHQRFDLVFTDIKMPGMAGLDLLREIKRRWPRTVVVIITGHGTIASAVEAMSEGAYDYITKPFNNSEILLTVDRIVNEHTLQDEVAFLRGEVQRRYKFQNLIGRDRQMLGVFELIRKVAPAMAPVLIRGESGTGKELVARAIHYSGPRNQRRFLAVNTSALPDSLLEAELFGARKGAFTGAEYDREGLFSQASEGTLFLDEIGGMSLVFQNKLLRAIQEMEITPLGCSETIKVDVRIVAATHVDLEESIRDGRFRKDLYYRLNVIQIVLPPLRERIDDIPLLAEHFVNELSGEQGLASKTITPAALRILMAHTWPGNVRELRNVVHRGLLIADSDELTHRDIIFQGDRFPAGGGCEGFYGLPYIQAKERAVEIFQREYVSHLLADCNGNITHAAQRSGITRTALRRIIQKHDLAPGPHAGSDPDADK